LQKVDRSNCSKVQLSLHESRATVGATIHEGHRVTLGSWLIAAAELLLVIETVLLLVFVVRRQAERVAFHAALAGGQVDAADPRIRRIERGAMLVGFAIGAPSAYLLLDRHPPAHLIELLAILALSILPLLLAQLVALWWTHDMGDEVFGDD
jgi:hypothetical protein